MLKRKKVVKCLSHYLIVIFIDLLADLYVLSPANLILAVYLPFLVKFMVNLATPFALAFAVYFLPLTFKVTFLPDFK